MSISKNLSNLNNSLENSVKLIAVSKTKSNQQIMEAYNQGQRAFGENKAQELSAKHEALPKDIEWHMIGHLQRNKVKYIAGFVKLIHSVDNFKLLKEINRQALKHNLIINCLLQIKIATEETKFGMSKNEAKNILVSEEFKNLKNVSILGLMGMASFTNDQEILKKEFSSLNNFFKELSSSYSTMKILSMGMSDDYKLAIELGSNMIRVGSSIFGSRN
ncbi:MAG: YggS family pyridoxal phosphate-dependent enzyme [Bacteroidota bacterium]|jgi:hypothetical protein|nr:YggS family pyridoxal phosphate-dependent enzyme [Bacteroidota bacterium]